MPLDAFSDQTMSRKAMKAELLDAETELRLAYAWRDKRDEAALHRLITAYMRLAISMASKFRRYGAPMNDLIQEASLGLMKAADKFDPDRGVRFSTYAVWWIKASIQDYVMRNWSMVRTGSTSSQKALFFNLRRVQAKLEREAESRGETLDAHQLRHMIAAEVGVPLADVEMMEGRLSGTDFSLNATQSAEDEGREWIDALEDDSAQAAETVEGAHDAAHLRNWLIVAIQGLNQRERFIVTERKLREAPRTLESLGEELGLSKERVRQLEAAAFGKMRRSLESQSREVHHFL
ncbi:RNA polymerase factor sigma-32 [Cereibacter sp. SYSU M97828]|nr:RNA polymerase factor sigma-32 [Cereibacter flavus]